MNTSSLSGGSCRGVMWGIACCWVGVVTSWLFLGLGASIMVVVPWNAFAVPALVTLGFQMLARRRR